MVTSQTHFQATAMQMSHQQTAGMDRSQFASVNGGRPQTAAMNEINGRRFDQQGRIANGAASGQLTGAETRNLEGREANLNRAITNERAENGGKLTPQERQNVNQRQNNISRSIDRDRHNAAEGPR